MATQCNVKHLTRFAHSSTVACVDSFASKRKTSQHATGILFGKHGENWIWSGSQRSALVLGPTRSGKTTSIIIPNVLCAKNAVVSTSTKSEVMEATALARAQSGACYLFDPTRSIEPSQGVRRIGWSPLLGAHSWDGALDISSSMVSSQAQRSMGASSGQRHWSERAGALLSTLMFAAAQADFEMAQVVAWTDRHHGSAALEILETTVGADHPATSLLTGLMATDSRELSGIWSTTSGVLAAYRSLGALEATRDHLFNVDEFVRDPNTLYVCAPGRQQMLVAPLVVGLLREVQRAGLERHDIDRPLLFALDELANIAPLPDLPQLVSEGGGQGVLTIGCLQDLSQARARWGPQADGFVSLFPTTLVLPGIADPSTLRLIQDLSGKEEALVESTSVGRDGRGKTTAGRSLSRRHDPALELDAIARGHAGHALLIDARNDVGWVELTPSWRDEPWRSLVTERRVPDLGRER
jgi:type IV secretion system protein VirD4